MKELKAGDLIRWYGAPALVLRTNPSVGRPGGVAAQAHFDNGTAMDTATALDYHIDYVVESTYLS